jgi:hypothetical protein
MQATSAAVAADSSCSGSIGIRKDHPAHAVRDTHTLCGLTVHVYNWYPIENPTTTPNAPLCFNPTRLRHSRDLMHLARVTYRHTADDGNMRRSRHCTSRSAPSLQRWELTRGGRVVIEQVPQRKGAPVAR